MRDELKDYVQRELFLAMDAGEITQGQYRDADRAIEQL